MSRYLISGMLESSCPIIVKEADHQLYIVGVVVPVVDVVVRGVFVFIFIVIMHLEYIVVVMMMAVMMMMVMIVCIWTVVVHIVVRHAPTTRLPDRGQRRLVVGALLRLATAACPHTESGVVSRGVACHVYTLVDIRVVRGREALSMILELIVMLARILLETNPTRSERIGLRQHLQCTELPRVCI